MIRATLHDYEVIMSGTSESWDMTVANAVLELTDKVEVVQIGHIEEYGDGQGVGIYFTSGRELDMDYVERNVKGLEVIEKTGTTE